LPPIHTTTCFYTDGNIGCCSFAVELVQRL